MSNSISQSVCSLREIPFLKDYSIPGDEHNKCTLVSMNNDHLKPHWKHTIVCKDCTLDWWSQIYQVTINCSGCIDRAKPVQPQLEGLLLHILQMSTNPQSKLTKKDKNGKDVICFTLLPEGDTSTDYTNFLRTINVSAIILSGYKLIEIGGFVNDGYLNLWFSFTQVDKEGNNTTYSLSYFGTTTDLKPGKILKLNIHLRFDEQGNQSVKDCNDLKETVYKQFSGFCQMLGDNSSEAETINAKIELFKRIKCDEGNTFISLPTITINDLNKMIIIRPEACKSPGEPSQAPFVPLWRDYF